LLVGKATTLQKDFSFEPIIMHQKLPAGNWIVANGFAAGTPRRITGSWSPPYSVDSCRDGAELEDLHCYM